MPPRENKPNVTRHDSSNIFPNRQLKSEMISYKYLTNKVLGHCHFLCNGFLQSLSQELFDFSAFLDSKLFKADNKLQNYQNNITNVLIFFIYL